MTEPDRSSPVLIQIRHLTKTFPGGIQAIDSLDLRIRTGEFVALIGPSGCGKSTLLRLIAGLDLPTQGQIDCELKNRSDIAYVFQDAHLLPWRKVLGNVALPLELLGVDRSYRDQQSRQILDQVGLGQLHERYPAQLSGGQRMRVSLARAMVTQPRLLLLDEPFAALDEITPATTRRMVKSDLARTTDDGIVRHTFDPRSRLSGGSGDCLFSPSCEDSFGC
ncbi:MAG: hypothetical protein KatS3mg104_2828 [Phycisphaerae bacterium]|nr:MAG: hypothetical protein KatS3mg104_2828 [Phycisphaerae bacterium]